MKKIIVSLVILITLGAACLAGDVRISAKSTLTEESSDVGSSWWDEVTDWVYSLFD